MKTRKTIGQKKMDAEVQQHMKEIKIPSWYSSKIGDVLAKTLPPNADPHLTRLHNDVVKALGENRADLQQANKVQQTGLADPTQTRSGAMVTAYEYSDNVFNRILKRSGPLENRINAYREQIDEGIDKTLANEARQNRYDAEVRAHMRSLKSEERMPYLHGALQKMDNSTLVSVLDAPADLSGISEDSKNRLLDEYKRRRFKNETATKAHLKELREAVGKGVMATAANIKVLDTPEVKEAIARRNEARSALA